MRIRFKSVGVVTNVKNVQILERWIKNFMVKGFLILTLLLIIGIFTTEVRKSISTLNHCINSRKLKKTILIF